MTDEVLRVKQEFASGNVEALLLAACGSGNEAELSDLYEVVGDEVAWCAAVEHELEGHVAHKLMSHRGASAIPERWATAHQEIDARLAIYLSAVDEIALELSRVGIPIIVLKNGGIARGIYRCLGCSPMGDLDFLVQERHFWDAHKIILDLGYSCSTRSLYDAEDAASGGLEYQRDVEGAGNIWIELQWRSVAGRWIQPQQEPNTDELFERSIGIDGTLVRLLSPEDNLLQVCLHTAKHSYLRAPGLRLHTDVERIVRGCTIDWQRFLLMVETLNVRTPVYFSLWLPAMLLGTPVPAEVLRELSPSKIKKALTLRCIKSAGLFHPKDRAKFNRTSYILFNMLLYDNVGCLLRAVFPSRDSMKRRYGVSSAFTLPYHHAKRIADLCLRRTGI